MNPRYLVFVAIWLCSGALAQTDAPADPIVGEWIFHDKYHVTVGPDGDAKYATGMQGTWRHLKRSVRERKYEFIWDEGVYIDTFVLSSDARKLVGTNKKGKPVHAERAVEAAH